MLKLATKFHPDEAMFQMACQAGFRQAEVWTDLNVLADWQAVARRAAGHPLRYVLHFPNRGDLGPEALRQAVALYQALDCRTMVIHQEVYDALAAPLRQLAPEMSLAIENHKLSPEELRAWAAQDADLTLDVEHVWKFTLRDAPLEHLLGVVQSLLRAAGPKLRHVHLPGYWPGLGEHRPMHSAREMVFPVLSLLEQCGYAGFVVSEVGLEYQTPQDLRMDVLAFELWRGRRATIDGCQCLR